MPSLPTAPPRPHYPPVQIDEPRVRVSPPPKHQALHEIISTLGVLLAALLIAFGLISFVFQSYQVDGRSMQQTLQDNDRLIIWKVPRTWARLTGRDYIPHRGDIIVFVENGLAEFGGNNSRQLIKRVIGLPGDHLVLKEGIITIYNADRPKGFNPDLNPLYAKTMNPTPSNQDIDITLGKSQVFVCGDNRPDSMDSRSFGPIEAHQIVGKLSLRLLPVSQIEKF